jgi:hypothetical protein
MKARRCPVCNKPLTEKEYVKALGIKSQMEEHWTHELDQLRNKLKASSRREAEARKQGAEFEKRRSHRLTAGLKDKLFKAQERIRQLRKGTTPQSEGLDLEPAMIAQLRRAFAALGDDIQHKGKGGDILHIVRFEGKIAGSIIYECKRCPRIKADHIEQTNKAKQTREADFAVLVTTGTKRGFSGFTQVNGIIVVAPPGIVALGSLLRVHLIEMLRSRIAQPRRAAIALKLVEYVTSPQCKNRIEKLVQTSADLQSLLEDEVRDHYKVWNKRFQHYKNIEWDGSLVQENLRLVLHGKEPKQVKHRVVIPLQLPAIAGK